MATRLPTGIGVLDQRLGGGIPAGSVLALTASPDSQAELILYELTAARETLYLTLDRSEFALADDLRRTAVETGDPQVQYVGGDDPIEHTTELVETLPEASNLVIDPHSILERVERSRYLEFVAQLQAQVITTDSLAVLHCLEGHDVPALRDLTEHVADVVFRLETSVEGARVENRLAVPKFRGGRALTDTIKLELLDRVEIDTSRDIA
ncbi:transcriptional regulator [Halobacteriales archaeon QS_4_69_34]|nr:MAG: transcriptional regulator [Halobacteriales archaeon QS_4_69_34]